MVPFLAGLCNIDYIATYVFFFLFPISSIAYVIFCLTGYLANFLYPTFFYFFSDIFFQDFPFWYMFLPFRQSVAIWYLDLSLSRNCCRFLSFFLGFFFKYFLFASLYFLLLLTTFFFFLFLVFYRLCFLYCSSVFFVTASCDYFSSSFRF